MQRLREKIAGNRRDTQHQRGFSFSCSISETSLFKAVLKDFSRFFNDIILILDIENIGNGKKLRSSIFGSIDKARKLIGSKERLDKITR